VSRESVVIEEPSNPGNFRRLTLRERASLQGFPITFQFYGESFSHKQKMVGNAIPPAFTYYLGQALKRVPAADVPNLSDAAQRWKEPAAFATTSRPGRPAFRYPPTRTFRFAIPSLRLKSGVRFELANEAKGDATRWRVAFYFGTPKVIRGLTLNADVYRWLVAGVPKSVREPVDQVLEALRSYLASADVMHMQRIWAHSGVGRTTPFMLLDELTETGASLIRLLSGYPLEAQKWVGETVLSQYGSAARELPGLTKLARHAPLIWAGLLVGSCANSALLLHEVRGANAMFNQA
jgi:DNA (cytosine-5)-methyltransferase 1